MGGLGAMKNFFKKIETIASNLNIRFKHETPADDTLDSAAFTLDGVAYCITRKGQVWQACGGGSCQAEDLVADVLLHHFCWRLRNEEAHYEVQSSQPLEARRREAIRRSFDDYEFAETVVASSGWDHDGQDTYKRAVFLEQGGNPSRQVTFYVEFKPLSDEISAIGDR